MLPHLHAVHSLYAAEQVPFRKVHRLIDLFESLIKTYTIVIIGESLRYNRLSEAAKGLLSQGLRAPSLRTWVLIGRELYKELGGNKFIWTAEGFAIAFEELIKALNQSKTDAVALRNKYTQGATPVDAECMADIRQFDPLALRLLQSPWLLSSNLVVKENLIFLMEGDRSLSLHPLLLYRPEQGDSAFTFFKDFKNNQINLINYPLSEYYHEKEYWEEFHRYLPLTEWKAATTHVFNQSLEELTETFKSKEEIRAHIYEVANKYEVERDSAWIDAVMQKSQGNPLYMKILCNGLENGSIILNNIETLPETIYEDYKTSEQQHWQTQLEKALNRIDLYYEKIDEAPQIVAMVGRGEIDAALQRITVFGGSDQEGIRRKFTLYMLCLMELTLLGEKNKSLRKKDINKLLQHLDEQLPVNHEILNWEDFFLSYLIFQIACECAALELDYVVLYKRTVGWESNWIPEKGPYTDLQFKVLKECARRISRDWHKSSALKDIAVALFEQGQVEESVSVMNESLAIAQIISNDYWKIRSLNEIAVGMSKQGQMVESICVANDLNSYEKWNTLQLIAIEVCKQGKVEESLKIARNLEDENYKSNTLKDIAIVLNKKKEIDLAYSLLQESLACSRELGDEFWVDSPKKDIAIELCKIGRLEEAMALTKKIERDYEQAEALESIAIELCKQGRTEESLQIARNLDDGSSKDSALSTIAVQLCTQGRTEESLLIARALKDESSMYGALREIAVELHKQGKVDASASIMQDSIRLARGLDNYPRNANLSEGAKELIKKGMFNESKLHVRWINQEEVKLKTLNFVVNEICLHEKYPVLNKMLLESISLYRGWENGKENEMNYALIYIAEELVKIGEIQKSIAIANEITDQKKLSRTFMRISKEIIKTGDIEKSLRVARRIVDVQIKCQTLRYLAADLIKMEKIAMAENLLKESQEIKNKYKVYQKRINEWDEPIEDTDSYLQEVSGVYRPRKNEHITNMTKNKNMERRLVLKCGMEYINVKSANKKNTHEKLEQLMNDAVSLENLLKLHAIHLARNGKPDYYLNNRLKLPQLNSY